MQGVGIGLILLGYCAWYTLYQRTAGDGSSYLYNLTGSTRFPGPITTTTPTKPLTKTQQQVISGQNNQGGQGPPGGRH